MSKRNAKYNQHESIKDTEIPSKWVKIIATLSSMLAVGLFLSIYSMIQCLQTDHNGINVVRMMIDSQEMAFGEIETSNGRQSSAINSLTEVLAEKFTDVSPGINEGNATQVTASQRNRQQLQSLLRNFHALTAQLQKFTTSKLESIAKDISTGDEDNSKELERQLLIINNDLIAMQEYTQSLDERIVRNIRKSSMVKENIGVIQARPVRFSDAAQDNGRVELFHYGAWGTICDNKWDLNDGHVFCRMLGYESASSVGNLPGGKGGIWFSEMECSGYEMSLMDCNKTSVHSCDHTRDASVVCSWTRLNRYYLEDGSGFS